MESYKVTVKAFETNQSGKPLLRCIVPGITPSNANPFPIPLNLTEEQGEMIVQGKTEYDVTLIRGDLRKDQQGNLKSGQYPDHYFYEVAMFEGIPNETAMARAQSETPMPSPSQPARSAPSPESDNREMVYRRQTGLNCASSLIAPLALDDDDDKFQRVVAMAERFVGYISTGRSDGLVDALIQDGASIVGEREPVYGYPEPPARITMDAFTEYTEQAGWSWDNVTEWLDGLDPIDWVKQEKGRTLKKALKVCKDTAVSIGLEPSLDFRVVVDEA
jgi:hypothetical protein